MLIARMLLTLHGFVVVRLCNSIMWLCSATREMDTYYSCSADFVAAAVAVLLFYVVLLFLLLYCRLC